MPYRVRKKILDDFDRSVGANIAGTRVYSDSVDYNLTIFYCKKPYFVQSPYYAKVGREERRNKCPNNDFFRQMEMFRNIGTYQSAVG